MIPLLDPETASLFPTTAAEAAELLGQNRTAVERRFRTLWLQGWIRDTGARRGPGAGRERWVYELQRA